MGVPLGIDDAEGSVAVLDERPPAAVNPLPALTTRPERLSVMKDLPDSAQPSKVSAFFGRDR
jgi:hypothetical protein